MSARSSGVAARIELEGNDVAATAAGSGVDDEASVDGVTAGSWTLAGPASSWASTATVAG